MSGSLLQMFSRKEGRACYESDRDFAWRLLSSIREFQGILADLSVSLAQLLLHFFLSRFYLRLVQPRYWDCNERRSTFPSDQAHPLDCSDPLIPISPVNLGLTGDCSPPFPRLRSHEGGDCARTRQWKIKKTLHGVTLIHQTKQGLN